MIKPRPLLVIVSAGLLAQQPLAVAEDMQTAAGSDTGTTDNHIIQERSETRLPGSDPAVLSAATVTEKPRKTAKPAAPIDVRWLATGDDGNVSLQIVSGVDHVGATVRLRGPGLGRAVTIQLPPALAGEIQTARWNLDQPVRGPIRAVIEIDTGDGTMARSAMAAVSRDKSQARVQMVGTRNADHGAAGAGRQADHDEGPLAELPVEQHIRRSGQ